MSGNSMVREARLIGTAIMFLTRLPVGGWCSADSSDLSRSSRWFPLVGLLVGALISLVYVLSSQMLPTSVCVVLMLVAAVMITGAFHEDGLADVADSAGAFGLDAKLVIMRDSRVGTYGSLALILLVALKGALLFELASHSVRGLVAALIVAHVSSRWSSVWLMARHDYARAEAANKVVAEGINARRLIAASLVAILIVMAVSLVTGAISFLFLSGAALLVSIICGWYFQRTFGGITGDCLGAANQIVEVAMLMGALVMITCSRSL